MLIRVAGMVTLIAGGIILSYGVNGGHVVTCGKWTGGCTTHGDTPEGFAYAVPFLIAAGLGLVAPPSGSGTFSFENRTR